MNTNKREQRIKLRIKGSPVKFDGTIMESSPDGKRIKVRFDGPLDDTVLVAYGDTALISDGVGRDGKPTLEIRDMVSMREWEVL